MSRYLLNYYLELFYLTYSAFWYFTLGGVLSLVLPARHFLSMLISLEVILLGITSFFIFSSIFLPDLLGQVIAFILLTLAGAESGLGLALLMVFYRRRRVILLEALDQLKS